MFCASLISLTKEIGKQVNSVLYNFISNSGQDKIKRLTLISDYKNGGLRMPHIETLIKTQRIMCMKKYLDSHNSTWKIFLDSYLADFGHSFLIKCNYHARFLPKTLPKFYKQRSNEWEDYKKSPVVTLPDVLKEFIWNNTFMCINGKPLSRKKVFKKSIGIRRQNQYCTKHHHQTWSWSTDQPGIISNRFPHCQDILSDEGKLKSWGTLQSYNLTGTEYSVLMSVFDAFPLEWKTLSKDMPNNLLRNNECHDNTFPTSSKEVYWDLIRKIEKPPVSKSKYKQLFPTHDLPWKDIYLLPISVTLDSKMREFQYKVLSRILYANKALHSMGIVNSPACTFCQESDESLEHLFLHCPTSRVFWLSVVVAKTRGRGQGRGQGRGWGRGRGRPLWPAPWPEPEPGPGPGCLSIFVVFLLYCFFE